AWDDDATHGLKKRGDGPTAARGTQGENRVARSQDKRRGDVRARAAAWLKRIWMRPARTGVQVIVVEEAEIAVRDLRAEQRLDGLRQQHDGAMPGADGQMGRIARLFGAHGRGTR